MGQNEPIKDQKRLQNRSKWAKNLRKWVKN